MYPPIISRTQKYLSFDVNHLHGQRRRHSLAQRQSYVYNGYYRGKDVIVVTLFSAMHAKKVYHTIRQCKSNKADKEIFQ